MMKKRIHLTESQFHDIIMEEVRKERARRMLASRRMDMLAKRQRESEAIARRVTENVIRKLKDAS